MDLFDDLPEPGDYTYNKYIFFFSPIDLFSDTFPLFFIIEKEKTTELLEPKIESWDNANVDMFSDLPVPSNTEVNRGVKRKLDESENDSPQEETGKMVFLYNSLLNVNIKILSTICRAILLLNFICFHLRL